MTTVEDVFYLYERNSNYYYNCNMRKEINKCPFKLQENICFCESNQVVLPFTIGDQCVSCNLNRKCYIKQGDECPICLEKIMNKIDAFITNCGHSFHKKCLNKYMNIKWLSNKWTSVVRCPICRCSLGYPIFEQRYRSSYYDFISRNNNELDKLEDFWLSFEYKTPHFCNNDYTHYLGTKKNCRTCKTFRENGDICV
jgi:hypothetical protein